MQITNRKRNQLLVSNAFSLVLFGLIFYLNHSVISLAVLLLLLVIINAVRLYSWSQM